MHVTVEPITTVEDARIACGSTIGKDSLICLEDLAYCEHSPLRTQEFWVEMHDIPTFVSVHLVRHKVGVEHFIKSNRDDRMVSVEGSTATLLGCTQAGLCELFDYRDGVLYWKIKPRTSTCNIGDAAGTLGSTGRTEINYRRMRALRYRIIYCMHHGWCPPLIDHINGDVSDDRIENLRHATKQQNAANMSAKEGKYKGVCKRSNGRYTAQIHMDGNRKVLGTYDTPYEAAVAYDEAATRMFGEFARRNFPSSDAQVHRYTPVTHTMKINAQALIFLARKRLCAAASRETREVMWAIKNACPEWLAPYMVAECIYRGGWCHELRSCGFRPKAPVRSADGISGPPL